VIKLKCTKKLLSRLGEIPSDIPSDSSQVLGDWVGNIIPIMGGELLIFLNERSLLTIVIERSAISDLRTAFRNQVIQLLEYLEIPEAYIQEVKSEMSMVSIVRTDGRRMLALLRDASYYFQNAVDFIPPDRIRNKIEMEMHMADWLYGPPPYQRPIDLLSELVQEFGGERA
jgi:hypothetical protein